MHRYDGGGIYTPKCANDSKEWGALGNMWMIEHDAAIFVCFLCTFGSPSRSLHCVINSLDDIIVYGCLIKLHWGVMPLHDAVGVNCENGVGFPYIHHTRINIIHLNK